MGRFRQDRQKKMRFDQMFLIVMSVPLLLLAALVEERSKGVLTLREREERISLAAESANLAFWSIISNGRNRG